MPQCCHQPLQYWRNCRRSKGQTQCSGAWTTAGMTFALIILQHSSKDHLHVFKMKMSAAEEKEEDEESSVGLVQ
ncbi:hypothetical protein ILYODFUR_011379 [Ilyodon furcidens]|uniref:Uncharacterized protein n=1 Tax=Ilyodon furcidens TaxID=33524 RepID=A0ABV0TTQ5_9TELE